jgi:3-phenylpropionate/trans-cinnamate dioxygenase ferredoxin subunit
MSDWTTICSLDELPPGAHRTGWVDDVAVAVFNLGGELFALEDVCTHDGGQLTGGAVEGDQIVCPRHGARFCIRDGSAMTPPAYSPTATFPVRVNEGRVEVRDARWD